MYYFLFLVHIYIHLTNSNRKTQIAIPHYHINKYTFFKINKLIKFNNMFLKIVFPLILKSIKKKTNQLSKT